MKKWVWSSIVILGVAALLFLAFLPTILSSEAGTRFLIRKVENATGGKLQVRDLYLSWLSGQKIDSLEYSEGEGFQLKFDTLDSSCSFWNLLFRSGDVGNTKIYNLNIVALPKISQKKMEELKEAKEEIEKPKGKVWTDFSGHLVLSNARVTIRNEGISFYGIQVDIDLGKTNAFSIEGKTRKNERVGSFYGQGKGKKILEGSLTLTNIPVEGLDQIASLFHSKYRGLLLAAMGDTVNGTFQSIPDQTGAKVLVDLTSPRLRANLQAFNKKGIYELTSPGRIALTVKPFLFNYFVKDLVLQSDAQAELRLENASLALGKKGFDFNKGTVAGTATFSKGIIFLKEIQETLNVNQLTANFKTVSLEDLLQLTLSSSMQIQGAPASIDGTLSIAHLFKTPTFPKFNLNLKTLPLTLIDSMNKSSLGKYLGATYTGRISKTENRFDISGATPLLSFDRMSLNINGDARLSQPARFTYRVTPALYEKLESSFPVEGIIEQLTVPTSKAGLLFKKSDFKVALNTGQIQMKDLFALGAARLPSLQGTLAGNSLNAVEFKLNSMIDYNPQTWGYAILGVNVGVNAEGRARFNDPFELSPLNLSLNGRKFQGEIAAAIQQGSLILKKGLQVNFLLEPDQINPILAKDSEYPLMTQPTPLLLEIKPSQIPLNQEALSSLSVKGVGKIANLSMVNPINRYPFNFRNVQLDFDLDGKKGSHAVHFEGTARDNDQDAGKLELALSGTGKASNLISSPETVKVSLDKFSSQIADVFFKTRGQLPDLVGPILDLKYIMDKMGGRQNLDLQIDSRDLNLDGAFYVGKSLELRSPRKPLKIRWNISEKSYDAFRRWRNPNQPIASNNPLFTIDGSGVLKIQISPFSVPIQSQGEGFPKPDFNLFGSRFDAAMQVDDLKLKHERTGALAELEKFHFDIEKKQVGDAPLTFKFNGDVTPFGKGSSGSIQGEGNMRDFFSNQGAFDFKNVTTSIHARVRNLPSIFVDALSKFDQASGFPPSAFLGDLFNATFDAEVEKSQGKITMDVDASACRANFSGIVSDGILYLHEPLKAAFTVTPQLNDVLERSAKLVVAAMEKPITLYIHDEGFSVPLKDLHIKNMSFRYGQLDLGQIICKNTGSASEVGGLFKLDGRGNVSVWFAPSEFNMNRGKVYVNRTEILYNHAYQVCLWGNVLFPRRYVDMTLGLTAQALRSALGIQGIDDDYVLKVPVEGPFGNVKIDTGAATGKIAFLVARKHIAPQTGIFGQVLGAVGDLADNQSDVPPPKPPFPWQKSQ